MVREPSSNLSLIGLAFTTITAGVGLLQTYYAALGQSLSNCPLGLNVTTCLDFIGRRQIVTQVDIWFPVGQFLITFGVSVITFVSLRIVYPILRQQFKTQKGILVLAFLALITFLFPILPPTAQNLSTVWIQLYALSLHWDVYWTFVASLIFMLIVTRSRFRYGLLIFVWGNAVAILIFGLLTNNWTLIFPTIVVVLLTIVLSAKNFRLVESIAKKLRLASS